MKAKFFDEPQDQSVVKATIISKYFWAWAKVIIPTARTHGRKIAYLDLFAGPGRYKDGTKSTPIMVLERAIADDAMREMLVTVFNDGDELQANSLRRAIADIPGIEKLKYPPVVDHSEVGSELVKRFQKMTLVPTLFFVDPWGYKGLSIGLIDSVLKDWGCDCIFFFNYNRINMGLSNPLVQEHMDCLFGSDRAKTLRSALNRMQPAQRELMIVENLCDALGANSGRFVLPFRFRDAQGTRTSHHLIFVTKHFRGYEIMKGIMAKESSLSEQGVPTFEYNRADADYPMLFELNRPLDDLEGMLLKEYASRTMTMGDVYTLHNVRRRYIKSNYKDVLKAMESKGLLICDPCAAKRRKDTMADNVSVTFPRRGRGRRGGSDEPASRTDPE